MDTPEPSPNAAPAKPARKTPKRHTYNPKAVKPRKSAKGPMKLLPTLISSGMAVLIILFAMGKLPQVDAFWDSLNRTLQSHNDEAVHFIYIAAPLLLFLAGAGGLFMLFKPAFRRKNKSA